MKKNEFQFNRPQLQFIINQGKTTSNIWGRATGKSFLIGILIKFIVEQMPRSSWILQGTTFKQLLNRTLPSTINALTSIGYKKDYHYFVGRKAPKSWKINGYWEEPYEAPLKFDHFIHFYTGTGFHLNSQDGGATSARGLNIDGIINDESLELDIDKFRKEVGPTNRGNLTKSFAGHPLHHSQHFFSSMPYLNQANWLTEFGNYYEQNGIDIFTIRDKISELQLDFLQNKEKRYRLQIWRDILELQKKLNYEKSPDGVFYSEANVFDNIRNVGLAYIEEEFRNTPRFIFDVEMLNRRVRGTTDGFYPLLDYTKHSYMPKSRQGLELPASFHSNNNSSKYDGDVKDNQELIISIDWGNQISCMTIAQDREGRNYDIVNELYVLHPKLVKELAKEFTDYYSAHKKKKVKYLPDAWGKTFRDPHTKKTYNETFIEELQKAGWEVEQVSLGKIPTHQDRYLYWHYSLAESDSRYPVFRFNRLNCKYTLLAMSQAKTKEGMKGEIKKDKKAERDPKADQRGTTHFTDTVDMHGLYKKKSFMGKYSDSFIDTSIR